MSRKLDIGRIFIVRAKHDSDIVTFLNNMAKKHGITTATFTIIGALKQRQVNLAMPKFEFESEFKLKDKLAAMGMPIAFSEAADFSGMTGGRDLYISNVVHKAFVSLDEAGTEAAAATAVIMKLTAAPVSPVEMTIDHPFIFLIRDIETDTILFLGRVLDPGK